jgi:hypothetical protein
MLPPRTADLLQAAGHEATTPSRLGAHNLPDDVLVQLAAGEARVIVTENAADFAGIASCVVLLVRKSWWPSASLAERLAAAVDCWATANPDPGPWAHGLSTEFRSTDPPQVAGLRL